MFYLEAIYLPALKTVVCHYEVRRFNRLWLTQIYIYQFYISDSIRLANDVETNPGPSTGYNDKFPANAINEKSLSSNEPLNNSNGAFVQNSTKLDNLKRKNENIEDNVYSGKKPRLATPNEQKENDCIETLNVNLNEDRDAAFLFTPYNERAQSIWCSALNLPLILKHNSKPSKELEQPSKLNLKYKVMVIVFQSTLLCHYW